MSGLDVTRVMLLTTDEVPQVPTPRLNLSLGQSTKRSITETMAGAMVTTTEAMSLDGTEFGLRPYKHIPRREPSI